LPEGHTVHRIANQFNKYFAEQKLKISSPQGRFAEDARLVSGKKLQLAEAFGKQMVLHFSNALKIRIHLGIYGKWQIQKIESAEEIPRGQVRVRFQSASYIADLRGPTACEVLDQTAVNQVLIKLGPDPLRPDPSQTERLRFIENVTKSKTAIGLLLMNQSVISGIGNVYRAEILFRQGINPHIPGSSLSPEQVSKVWDDAVKLLAFGVKKGIMVTRDELLGKSPQFEDRYFVYKRNGLPCRVCGKKVVLEQMGARKLYFCPKCQK
jgi:DNA-formamidopyrimidine glycosylase